MPYYYRHLAPFYEQDDLRNPTKGKIRSNCYITQKQIHFFPTVQTQRKTSDCGKFKSAINSIGKLLHALLSIYFFFQKIVSP